MAAWPPKGVLSMRKTVFFIVALFALLVCAPVVQAVQSGEWLSLEQLDRGVIVIRHDVTPGVKTKLMIAKEQGKYTYTLSPDKLEEAFPLQMGNGDYTISVLEQVGGTKYKIVREAMVPLQLANGNAVFLGSVQNIRWSETSQAVQLAKELTRSSQSDAEKVRAIYDYIVGTIRYDEALAAGDLTDYVPDIDRTIARQQGICYDYASLFASMLRSVGIPAKLVMGNSDYVSVYHSWNEVYIGGQWVTIDTTVDAGWQGNGAAAGMIKDASRYFAAKHY